MKFLKTFICALFLAAPAFAQQAGPQSFPQAGPMSHPIPYDMPPDTVDEAEKLFQKNEDNPSTVNYIREFTEYDSEVHLSTRTGCYNIPSKDPVIVLLAIDNAPQDNPYAQIDAVFTDKDTPRARCFKQAFLNAPVKSPPYLPFVIMMKMNGDGQPATLKN